jgi:nitrogen fixation NifU-like protein
MNDDALRALYEEVILDHNRNPRNFLKHPPGAAHHAHGYNPLCGDEFTVHLRVEEGVIRDAGFEGAGCAISTASASLMTEAVKGRTVDEVRQLFGSMHNLLTGTGQVGEVGKLRVLAGVQAFPMRVKCATLPWHTLVAALENREGTVSTEEAVPSCEQPHVRDASANPDDERRAP